MGVLKSVGGSLFPKSKPPSYAQRKADQRRDHAFRQSESFYNKAHEVRWGLDEKVRRIDEAAAKDAAAAAKEIDSAAEREVKRVLSPTVTQWKGGIKQRTVIWHWKAPNPNLDRTDAGPIYVIPRVGQGQAATANPKNAALLAGPEGRKWAENVHTAVTEMKERYLFLPKLCRDRQWLAQVLHAAGVTKTDRDPDTTQTPYGPVDRTIETIRVPVLERVEIDEDGLVLVFAYYPGDNTAEWSKRIDALRNIFRNAGVNASHLRILDGHDDGSVQLHFGDAPSNFPKAIAPEPPTAVVSTVDEAIRRYHAAEWVMGVDARGNWLTYPLADHPHAFVVGGTGGGKSVWVRTQIEMLRTGYHDPRTGEDSGGGWRLFIASGKPSDFAGLEGFPGIQMVATDTAQLIVMLQAVKSEMDRRIAAAAQAKREGKGGSAFNFQPMCVVLDEFGYLGMSILTLYGTKGLKWFRQLVDSLLRVARETRIHVVLSTQTVRKEQSDPASIPGTWQANISMAVSLGKPDDSETLNNAFGPATRERAAKIGPRLVGHKGRGMTGDELAKKVIIFQSLYGWSPGTTSLDPRADPKVAPPTDEVRESWERWEPISASVPWLAPRLGIKAASPQWSDGELEQVSLTPVVVLTDRDGNLCPGMEKCDPMSPEWVGHAQANANAPVLDFDGVDDQPSEATAPQSPAAEPAARTMTPDEKEAEIRRIARERGWLKDEDAADQARLDELVDNADDGPPNPLADKVNDDGSIGEF